MMTITRKHGQGTGSGAKTLAITAVFAFILFVLFRFALFSLIGWHDGLNLDWYTVYYPAIRSADPFSVPGYFNPPWLAWILSPLGLLAAVDAHALWIVVILITTVYCVYKMGGGWLAAVLAVLSPGFLVTIINGQVDILVLLGLVTGSWLLVLVKPQVAGLAVIYDVIAERRIDWAAVLVAAFSVIAFVLFMSWPAPAGLEMRVSISPWPWGIPVGIALFFVSIRKRDKYLAALATFFFTPYLSGSSLLVYSAICTSRYGRIAAIVFSVVLWAFCIRWFL